MKKEERGKRRGGGREEWERGKSGREGGKSRFGNKGEGRGRGNGRKRGRETEEQKQEQFPSMISASLC